MGLIVSDSIELGGNIVLTGFRDIEPSKLVVLKKIIGNYAKQMSEKVQKFEKLEIRLSKPSDFAIEAILSADGTNIEADTTDKNLFFGIGEVLKNIIAKI